MEKLKYTEYSEIIKSGDEIMELTVQIPENYPEMPMRIIEKRGNKVNIHTEDEWSQINDFAARAMKEAGYKEEAYPNSDVTSINNLRRELREAETALESEINEEK